MRKIVITVSVSTEIHAAAKCAAKLLQTTDPAMLGQFVDYELIAQQFVKGVLLELNDWLVVNGSVELNECYFNDETVVAVLHTFAATGTDNQFIMVRLVL